MRFIKIISQINGNMRSYFQNRVIKNYINRNFIKIIDRRINLTKYGVFKLIQKI